MERIASDNLSFAISIFPPRVTRAWVVVLISVVAVIIAKLISKFVEEKYFRKISRFR
jgi:hypothetical protein